ncbi:hypothetical protein PGTUg99_000179 [Puccinia graminis f. sp. tritici]|uniref:Uncharacterized protein n=1 Tax=Puccinia graminis f. sp. tritici TaxID=56615 RepID=A0A5B0MK54_PUCGR|nr:hypothetical protein PGTUg99_000179 [Puccinia graminis f. sp. tritici]
MGSTSFRPLSLLKFEDRLYADPLYYKAVSKATHSEVNPDSLPNENGGPKPEDDSTKSKKALKKAKMAEIKAKAQAALEAKKASSKNKNGDQASTATPDVIPPIPDDDPTGEKLLKTENPLEMLMNCSGRSRTILQGLKLNLGEYHLPLFFFTKPDKPLLALRALLKAHDLSPDQSSIDPSVFVALSKLKVKYLSSTPLNGSTPDTDSTTTTNVLRKALEKIEQLELSEGYRGRLARAESFIVQRTHKPSTSSTTNEDTELFSNKQIEDEIFSLFSSSNEDILNQWKIGLQGLQLLESFSSSRTEEFKSKAQDLWKFVDYFRPPPIGGNKQQDQLDSVPANNHFTHHPRHSNSIATDTPIPDGPATPQDHPDGSKTEGLVEVRDF